VIRIEKAGEVVSTTYCRDGELFPLRILYDFVAPAGAQRWTRSNDRDWLDKFSERRTAYQGSYERETNRRQR